MRTISLEVSEEVVRHAEQVAAEQGIALSDLFTQWLTQGHAESAIEGILAIINPKLVQEKLSNDDLMHVAEWLSQPPDTLKQEESIDLEELLRTYRQSLVGKAQAITDWLTIKSTLDTRRQVTHLTTVTSTMLYAIGYDAASQTLDVIFNTGGIYRYLHVPSNVYRDLLAAESVGQYMWRNVLRHYPVVRLGK